MDNKHLTPSDIDNRSPERRKNDLLRTLHSRILKDISLIMFEPNIDKILFNNLKRNYRSIISIIAKEANK